MDSKDWFFYNLTALIIKAHNKFNRQIYYESYCKLEETENRQNGKQ